MPKRTRPRPNVASRRLEKAPTGVHGLDEILYGGLPRGRTSLVAGGPGSGKTMLGLEFLIRGALDFGEPGIFMSFEETPPELVQNVASLGYDLPALERSGRVVLDHVRVERSEIEETGEYDLEGLFIRIGEAAGRIGARRIVLDTLESLFSGLPNPAILRAELRRLFWWLKDQRLTTLITGERGTGGDGAGLTREGLEEYVSDCVIVLDNRVIDQISTRRLRVVKYRGSIHGANEYPFFIGDDGFSVAPVTSLNLDYPSSRDRVSAGVAGLDEMLEGKGYFRGSTVLISGTAGTGKSSLAASFADAACRRGERTLYFSFEESESQILRNMESIGLRLRACARRGRLRVVSQRPTLQGLERLLSVMHREIEEYRPRAVVMDPINNLTTVGSAGEIKMMVTRLMDELKKNGITAVFTSLTEAGGAFETTSIDVSSLADTWILIRDIEVGTERVRGIYVLKSRGMSHATKIRELRITGRGVKIADFPAERASALPERGPGI